MRANNEGCCGRDTDAEEHGPLPEVTVGRIRTDVAVLHHYADGLIVSTARTECADQGIESGGGHAKALPNSIDRWRAKG
jgi:hypothetical protein